MSYCSIKEFQKELEGIKDQLHFCDHSTDIIEIVYALKRRVREHYPINSVPQVIVDSLRSLEERFKIAEEQLYLTCDVLINELEKQEKS